MPVTRFYSSTAGKMTLQLGVTAVATALSVDTTVGLPGSTPFTLLLDAGSSAEEIVTVTQVSGNTLVVQRGQDGTSAQAHANGAIIRHALTARDLRDSREHEAAVSAHGTTSNVVGVNDAQALTNKNLAAASNVFPTTLATSATVTAHTAATVAHGATGAVVGTTNVQTLTNKTLAAPQFTGTVTNAAGTIRVGDATATLQPYFSVVKKAVTGANTYEAKFYLSNADVAARLANVLVENGTEVGRTEIREDGTFTTNSDVQPGGDLLLGSATSTTQRTVRATRKATTGTNTYEASFYLGDPGDGTLALVNRLAGNGVEQSRLTMYGDGRGIVTNRNITAANIDDSGWISTGFASQTGWSETTSAYRVRNGVCTVNLRFSRSGSAIAVGSTGGVADTNVTIIPTAARSGFTVTGSGVALTAGGSYGFLYQIRNGVVTIIASTNPNVSWNTGADFYTTITYLI